MNILKFRGHDDAGGILLLIFTVIFSLFVSFYDLSNWLAPEPESEIIAIPEAESFFRISSFEKVVWEGEFEITAYSPPLFPRGQLTRSETPVGPGVVAVDPRIIPLGSKLRIHGLGQYNEFNMISFRAEDTGRLIQDNNIDIWMSDKQTALNWGRRKRIVQLIEKL